MRLIDADALKIRDISPAYWQVVDGVTEYDIEDAPTVEAIPIDWIESQVDKGKWAELVQRWSERIEE